MSKKVKVVFPGGRKTYMDRKTAETKTVVKMGGRIVEEMIPEVPKSYAKPIVDQAQEDPKPKAKGKDESFSLDTKPTKPAKDAN